MSRVSPNPVLELDCCWLPVVDDATDSVVETSSWKSVKLALPKQFQLVLLHLGFQTFVLYQNLTFEQIGRRQRYSWLQLFYHNDIRYMSFFFSVR